MARGDAGVLGRWVFVTVWRWGLLRSSPRLSLCRTDPRADAHCLPGLSHWWDKWAIQERRAEENNLWPNVSKSCSSHHHGNELGRDNNSGGGGPASRCLQFPETIVLFFHRFSCYFHACFDSFSTSQSKRLEKGSILVRSLLLVESHWMSVILNLFTPVWMILK